MTYTAQAGALPAPSAIAGVSPAFFVRYTIATVGLFAAILALPIITIALRIEEIFPGQKTQILGIVTGIGAVFAIISNPLSGMLSDRTRTRFGRRKPWIIGGTIGGLIAALVIANATTVWMLVVGWALAQCAYNSSLSSLVAIVPDQVPPHQRAKASSIFGFGSKIGALVGVWTVNQVGTDLIWMFLAPALVGIGATLIFVLFNKDEPVDTVPPPAIDDVEATAEISSIMAEEAHAVGLNWSFTPVVDINAAFRSAIVATRGFGSDPAIIARHARRQIEVFQAAGIAATAKHWPGEGYDDRDQHLVTTIIPLSMEEWRASFGALYSQMIEAGVKSVMTGHIALPAYSENPEGPLDPYRPATVSRRLNIDLLRGELGFNGLIVSDATSMGGFGSFGPRRLMIPDVIASGCDLILFSNDPRQDIVWLREALADGRLSQDRVDEAVLTTLAFKASLGLHLGAGRQRASLADPSHKARAIEISARAPTLIKDVQGILPLSPDRHRKVYLFDTGVVQPSRGNRPFTFPDMMRAEGFEVTVHDPWAPPGLNLYAGHDLILYLLGEETLLTRGHIHLDWLRLTGFFGRAMERPWWDIPTAMISFGYPYYLYDAPRMPCVVNAYAAMDSMQRVTLDCLLGRRPWQGVSPVDPFCGLPDARF